MSNRFSSAQKQPRPRKNNAAVEIIKAVGGGALGLALAVLVLSYFAGIDLLGWSKGARESKVGNGSANPALEHRPADEPAAVAGQQPATLPPVSAGSISAKSDGSDPRRPNAEAQAVFDPERESHSTESDVASGFEASELVAADSLQPGTAWSGTRIYGEGRLSGTTSTTELQIQTRDQESFTGIAFDIDENGNRNEARVAGTISQEAVKWTQTYANQLGIIAVEGRLSGEELQFTFTASDDERRTYAIGTGRLTLASSDRSGTAPASGLALKGSDERGTDQGGVPAMPDQDGYVRLVDLVPLDAEVGWGRFQVNTADLPGAEPIVGPQLHFAAESIFAHAPSRLVYEVPRAQRSFTVVGYCPSSRDVRFSISTHRELLAESEHGAFHRFKVDLPERTTEIHLVVDDLGKKESDESFWCYPRFHRLPANEVGAFDADERCVPLTKLRPLSATVGYGKLLVNESPAQWLMPLHPDSIMPCDEYLYAHADSRIRYSIPQGMTQFSAIGYAMKSQSVRFLVMVDDEIIEEIERAGIEPLKVDLPSNGKVLTLITESLGSTYWDHAYWCYPRFDRGDPTLLPGTLP